MAMARAMSGLAYPDRFFSAASYAGFDKSDSDVSSKFKTDVALLLYALYQETYVVEISQVMYRNISGTTKSKQAMKFACNDAVPCSIIILDNVNLEKEDGTTKVY